MLGDLRLILLNEVLRHSKEVTFIVPKITFNKVSSALIDLSDDNDLFVCKESFNDEDVKITVGFKK